LTTEYFATVVFRPHTRSVHYSELALEGLGPRASDVGPDTARSPKLEARSRRATVSGVLMVKLLRAYGECLGARSR
jgi:hypothetical protein